MASPFRGSSMRNRYVIRWFRLTEAAALCASAVALAAVVLRLG